MNKLLNLQGKLDLERIKNLFPKSYFLLNQINESRKGTGSSRTVRILGKTESALIRFDQIHNLSGIMDNQAWIRNCTKVGITVFESAPFGDLHNITGATEPDHGTWCRRCAIPHSLLKPQKSFLTTFQDFISILHTHI